MRRAGRLLLACLLGALAVVAIVEVGLRAWAVRGVPETTATHTSDPILHHRLRPNITAQVRGVEFRTSSLGLHDREYPPRKPDSVFRILLLGDSFTEGGGLPLEATVAKQVEAMLATRRCRPSVEVVNGGIASYSPILEYLFLRDVGLALEPDLVVLNFDMTDVHDDVLRTAGARLGPDGLPLAVPTNRRLETALLLPPLQKLPARWPLDYAERSLNRLLIYQTLRRSRMGQALFGPLRLTPERLDALGLVGDIRYDTMAITRDGAGPALDDAWRITQRYLEGVHQLARRHGIPFVVVVQPHPHQVAATESLGGRLRFALPPGLYASEEPFRRIEALGSRAGFPVINLLHHFRRHHATDGNLYWDDDIHHNPRGARVFAEGIVTGLLEHRLVRCD